MVQTVQFCLIPRSRARSPRRCGTCAIGRRCIRFLRTAAVCSLCANELFVASLFRSCLRLWNSYFSVASLTFQVENEHTAQLACLAHVMSAFAAQTARRFRVYWGARSVREFALTINLVHVRRAFRTTFPLHCVIECGKHSQVVRNEDLQQRNQHLFARLALRKPALITNDARARRPVCHRRVARGRGPARDRRRAPRQ